MSYPKLSRTYHPKYEIYSITGFGRPFGLGQDPNGFFYITDMDLHTIFRVSPDIDSISWLDPITSQWLPDHSLQQGIMPQAKPCHPVLFNGPHSIDFNQQSDFFVTSYYTPLITIFNSSAQCMDTIGDKNSSHPLTGPASAFLDDNNRLLVAEYTQNAILAYTLSGKYLGGIGFKSDENLTHDFQMHVEFVSSKKPGGFDRPHMIKQGPDGFLYCADTWNHRIQKLSPTTGKPLAAFTHKLLKNPVSISFMTANIMITSSWGNNNVLGFTTNGALQFTLNNLKLNKPYDIQIYYPWLVTADSGNGRVLFMKLSENNL